MEANSRDLHARELWLTQIWETIGTGAKAAFFFIAASAITRKLGPDRYGSFALALSSFTCMTAFDFGLRLQTRVEWHDHQCETERNLLFNRNIAAACMLHLAIATLVGLAGVLGIWSASFGGDRSLNYLIPVMSAGGALYTISMLLLEPLAAVNRLSGVKAAICTGNIIAIPATLGALACGASVTIIGICYALSLTAPNLVLASMQWGQLRLGPFHLPKDIIACIISAVRSAKWYSLFTLLWLAKTYVLTFAVATIAGREEAGRFFILLKLSELLSVLAASGADTAIASIASRASESEKARTLIHTYQWVLTLSGTGLIYLAFAFSTFAIIWLSKLKPDPYLGLAAGLFGVAGAVNRLILSSCVGAKLTRTAVACGTLEAAVAIGCSFFLYHWLGLLGFSVAALLGSLTLLPAAVALSMAFQRSFAMLWLEPALKIVLYLASATVVTFLIVQWHGLPGALLALGALGAGTWAFLKRL